MELSARVLLCCPCFGEFVTVEGLAEERSRSERTWDKTHACPMSIYFCDAVCGEIARKRPLQKDTDVYQEHENS